MKTHKLSAAQEQSKLEALVAELLANQRLPDDDGVLPPPILDIVRMKRPSKANLTPAPPRNSRLVTLRIWALLLIQYEHRCGRTEACAILEESIGASKGLLSATVTCFGALHELNYNPYGYQSYTVEEVQDKLKPRGIRLITQPMPHERIKASAVWNFECIKGLGHTPWEASLRNSKKGCAACANMDRNKATKKKRPLIKISTY